MKKFVVLKSFKVLFLLVAITVFAALSHGCTGKIVSVEFTQDSSETSTNSLGFQADGSSLTTATDQNANGQVLDNPTKTETK